MSRGDVEGVMEWNLRSIAMWDEIVTKIKEYNNQIGSERKSETFFLSGEKSNETEIDERTYAFAMARYTEILSVKSREKERIRALRWPITFVCSLRRWNREKIRKKWVVQILNWLIRFLLVLFFSFFLNFSPWMSEKNEKRERAKIVVLIDPNEIVFLLEFTFALILLLYVCSFSFPIFSTSFSLLQYFAGAGYFFFESLVWRMKQGSQVFVHFASFPFSCSWFAKERKKRLYLRKWGQVSRKCWFVCVSPTSLSLMDSWRKKEVESRMRFIIS